MSPVERVELLKQQLRFAELEVIKEREEVAIAAARGWHGVPYSFPQPRENNKLPHWTDELISIRHKVHWLMIGPRGETLELNVVGRPKQT